MHQDEQRLIEDLTSQLATISANLERAKTDAQYVAVLRAATEIHKKGGIFKEIQRLEIPIFDAVAKHFEG